MYRELCEREQQWISTLMDVEFLGKDILLLQFSRARIIYKQEYSFISLKFKVEDVVEQYPYHVRVPIQMRVFQKALAPIVFLLHIVNGIIDELEIITADSTKIDLDNMKFEKVEYDINQQVVVRKH